MCITKIRPSNMCIYSVASILVRSYFPMKTIGVSGNMPIPNCQPMMLVNTSAGYYTWLKKRTVKRPWGVMP